MEIVKKRAHRKDAVGILHDCLDDVNSRHGNSIVGAALAFNDLISSVLHILMDLFAHFSSKRFMPFDLFPVEHRDAADSRG